MEWQYKIKWSKAIKSDTLLFYLLINYSLTYKIKKSINILTGQYK